MKVTRLKLLSSLSALTLVLAVVTVAPPLASPAEAATMELQYDNGTPFLFWDACLCSVVFEGVRFSLPEGVPLATVTAVRFYYSNPGNVTIYITGSDHITPLTTIAYHVNGTGWCDVGVSGVTVSDDFYVIIERYSEWEAPAYDDDGNCGRSSGGLTLSSLTVHPAPGDLLIRAVINFGNPGEIHVPTDYPTIQAAVDAADPGYTIIVHEGTYTENVNVNKSLTIQAATGENVTVQAANPDEYVFNVTAGYVNITGLTVTGATGFEKAGIYLGFGTDHCTITNNTAESNYSGIRLDSSNNNTISGNTVSGNDECGIWLSWQDSGNTISGNTASGNWAGIYLYRASENTISDNKALDNDYGIYVHLSSGNTLTGNTASDNAHYGIYLSESNGNTIEGNNTASGNDHYGIYLFESNGNTIEGNNTASGNEYCGISLRYSSDNTIEGNTASDSNRGIDLEYSSDNTISGNTAADNWWGIHLYYSSGNTISSNIANENNNTAIYLEESSDNNIISGNAASDNWWGIYLYYSSNNTLSGNIANENNNEGICLDESSNNTVSGNTASGNNVGIEVIYSSDNNTFLNNTVHDNGHGIYIEDSSGNLFLGNDIRGNTAIEDSGVHLLGDGTDNQFLLNNIVNNTAGGSYGVYNEAADIVNASLNWWGDASGPYHPTANPGGTGDAVSDNVTFEPWLGAGVIAEDITGAQEDVEISGPTGSDTTLTVNTSGDVTVAVALYSGNPHPEEPFPDIALGKYIDIYASDPDAILWPVRVEMSYTEDEVAAAGIDETALGLYYWDASANEFHRCSDTGVDTATNIIWANVTEEEAGGLAGTPFAPGGAAPEAPGGLSGGAIAGIIVGAIAGAVLIFFAVRKWVWKS